VGTAARAFQVDDRPQRVLRTVALLERRGYALSAGRLGTLCLGGPVSGEDVLAAAAIRPELRLAEGLVLTVATAPRAPWIAERARRHRREAPAYLDSALGFARLLVALCPFVLGIAIAGSLASGGFVETDDVDLNLIVEDGHRHLAYCALNALGLLHALRHRRKPVDGLTRRPLAPRLLTANLILERRQCFPLPRQDEQMAFELLASQPCFGTPLWRRVVGANPGLRRHFPQLEGWAAAEGFPAPRRAPGWLFPAMLDGPARGLGSAAWRWMQWTRRHDPEALERVAYVRQTMRPYTLFDAWAGQ